MQSQPHLDLIRLDPDGLYARLGLTPSATPEEIAAAFRRKARILHPDVPVTGDSAAFVAVRQAYDTLGNLQRRAAYDRSARRAALTAGNAGNVEPLSRPAKAASLPHPRLSDLPIGLWIAAAIVICLGLTEAAIHLSRDTALSQSTQVLPASPGVSAAPAATPAENSGQSTNPDRPPAPVQLAGTPNFYVVPAAGAAVLWRLDADRNALVRTGQLPPFSTVQALRLFRQNGLVEVKVADNTTGLVDATRLTSGNTGAARRAYCAYYAGPPPGNGEVLERHVAGPATLDVTNRTAQPIVMKLRDTLGAVAVSVFLSPGAQATVTGLPGGPYRPDFAIGELWSRACNSFAAGMRAQRLPKALPLDALSPLTLPPDTDQPAGIPDSEFDAE